MLSRKLPLVLAAAGLLCLGLGCSDDDAGGTSQCPFKADEDAKVKSVTNKSTNSVCPNLTPKMLNGPSKDDAGSVSESCAFSMNAVACSGSMSCTGKDADGTSFSASGSFSTGADKQTMSGTLTMTFTSAKGESVTCRYDITLVPPS